MRPEEKRFPGYLKLVRPLAGVLVVFALVILMTTGCGPKKKSRDFAPKVLRVGRGSRPAQV